MGLLPPLLLSVLPPLSQAWFFLCSHRRGLCALPPFVHRPCTRPDLSHVASTGTAATTQASPAPAYTVVLKTNPLCFWSRCGATNLAAFTAVLLNMSTEVHEDLRPKIILLYCCCVAMLTFFVLVEEGKRLLDTLPLGFHPVFILHCRKPPTKVIGYRPNDLSRRSTPALSIPLRSEIPPGSLYCGTLLVLERRSVRINPRSNAQGFGKRAERTF